MIRIRMLLITFFICFSLTGKAQSVIVNLSNVAPPGLLNLEIKSFTDNDSIYYLKFNTRSQKPGEFYFMFITPEISDTIVQCALNKSFKYKQRLMWMQSYIDRKKKKNMDYSKVWTKYKPKKIYQRNGYSTKESFGFLPAWREYTKQHHLNWDGTKKKEPTVQEWITFLKVLRQVGALMPQGETRPLVDQIRNLP